MQLGSNCSNLHHAADVLSVWEDLAESFGAEHVPECRLGEQVGRELDVRDVDDGHCWVVDAVVYDGIYSHRDRVTGQDLHNHHHNMYNAQLYMSNSA